MNYKEIPMDVRIDRIGSLLAKAVHLAVLKERSDFFVDSSGRDIFGESSDC